MVAVMTIINDNLQLKYRKSMRGLESIGQIFFISYMKLTYDDTINFNQLAIIIDNLSLKY